MSRGQVRAHPGYMLNDKFWTDTQRWCVWGDVEPNFFLPCYCPCSQGEPSSAPAVRASQARGEVER